MAKITLELEVNAEKGTATLKQFAGEAEAATKKAGEGAKEGGKGFGQFASALDETAEKLKGLLTPANLLGAGIGYGLVEALHHAQDATIEYASELIRLKGVTGASIEELGGLREAADKMGVGSDKLQRALLLMSSQIESGGEALGRMGISIEDANGKQKAELTLLFEVIDTLSGMTNKTEAAALAKKTFGRSVGELLPLLLAGSAHIRELGQSGAAFAREVGDDALVKIREFKGELTETGDAVTRLQITVMRDAIPVLSVLATTVVTVLDAARQVPPEVRMTIEVVTVLAAGFLSLAIAAKTAGIALGLIMALPGVGTVLAEIAAMAAAATAALMALPAALSALILTAVVSFLFDIGGIRTEASRLASTLTTWLGEQITSLGLPSIRLNILPKGTDSWTEWWQALGAKLGVAPELNYPTQQSDIYKPRVGMPPIEGYNKAVEEGNLALKRKRLEIDKEILAETLKFYQATQAPEQAQISALRENLALKIRELEVKKEERKDLAGMYDKEADQARRAAAAQETAIAVTAIKTIDAARAESLKADIAASETGEAKIRDLAKAETDAVTQQLKDQAKARSLSDAEIIQAEEKKKQIAIKASEELRKLAIEQASQLSAIAQKEADTALKARENEIEQNIAGLELEQVARQHAFDTFTISQAQFTAESIAHTNAVTQAKLASLKAQEDAARDNATREMALAESRWAGITGGEKQLAIDVAKIDSDLAAKQTDIASQRVKVEDDATKHILELKLQEAKQAGILFAQEAGYIEDLKRKREQSLQNIGIVLEQQARQAGDLGAAYQVGFAQAVSSADDASAAMKKAGADTYQALKSGFSDFLYDTLTGAKNIGDVFVNLGKRILRSMTDAFAEIIAKQAVMAAGFSLPGLLGTAGVAVAGAGGSTNQAAQAVQQLGTTASGASQALSEMTGGTGAVIQMFAFLTTGVGKFIGFLSSILQAAGLSSEMAGGLAQLVTGGGISFGLGSLIFGSGAGGMGAGLGGTIGTLASLIAPQLTTQLLGQGIIQATTFLLGPALTSMLGNLVLPGIGFVIGGILGKLFGGLFSGPTPQISGMVRVNPTNLASLLAAGSVSPADVVNPPGRSHFSYLQSGPFYEELYKHRTQGALNRDETQATILNIIISTIQAAVKGLEALTPKLPAHISQVLSERIDAVLAAGIEITDFNMKGKKTVEKFQEWLKQLSGATLEVFTQQLFPSIDLMALGADDAVKGFDTLTSALANFSDLLMRSGHATAFAGDTLDEFATRSVDFFKGFQKEGEALADTITRVTDEVGNLITQLEQFRTSTNQFLLSLQTQISTISMQSGGGLGEFNLLRQVAPGIIGGLPRDLQLQMLGPLVASLVSQAKTAIETGQPLGDILAGRQSLIDLGAALFGKLQQESDPVAAIQGLQLLATAAQELLSGEIEAVQAYYGQLIAQEQARLTGLEQERQTIQASTDALEAEITAMKAASEARLAPLKEEQQLLHDQLSTLREQAQALQAWQDVVDSVRKQLLDMQLALDNPQNALERLALAQQAVAQAKAAFASQGTPEAARVLQTALGDELKIAQEAFRRPSDAYQNIFNQVSADLQGIQSVAEANAGDLERLTQQIAEKQARLTAITEQIQAIERETANAVRPLEASLTALKAANDTRLAQIHAEEIQVRATIQERITALQQEQAALITQFRQEAVGWLQAIRNEAFARLEQAIREGDARIAALLGLPSGSGGTPPAANPQIAQAANALMALAQLSQGSGLTDLATALATSSRFITAGVLPDAITSAMRALSIAQMTPALMFPGGQEAISRFAGIIDAARANQFDQAVNGLDNLLTFLRNLGLTSMVPVPGFQAGLEYVPHDDFLARLHRGERVLTAEENRAYATHQGGDTITISFSPAIHLTVQGDESPEAIRRKVDEATADLLTTPSRTRAALVRFAREHR